jgi:TatD DNase family protein
VLFDTHVHFDGLTDRDGVAGAVARAAAAGVGRMVAMGRSPEANALAVSVADSFPDRVRPCVGYERDWAETWRTPEQVREAVDGLRRDLDGRWRGRVAALGEMGLDFHYGPDMAEAQTALFRAQLALARETRLPVVVHSREAETATLAALREHREAWAGEADRIGVLHCFTGDAKFAEGLARLGFFVSFSGILTFRNAGGVREAAAKVPGALLLAETDSPFLAPEPVRGGWNEPANVVYVVAALARVRGIPVEQAAHLTAENAARLFNWPLAGTDATGPGPG